ncbi:MAG: beta-lactamase family protein, partial [Deltaproteobacteria bacterium]|nr:beta-lactamase family protein [Deltaproteobacteria bacterium]
MKSLQKKNIFALYILFIFGTLVFYYSYACASVNTFPTEGWHTSNPEKQGMDSAKLSDMLEKVLKEKPRIDSITIIRNGHMVLDAYFYPFKKHSKHIIHSCTKSITSAAFGIAMDKGYIKNIEQPVVEIFPEKQITNLTDDKKAITLKNLLTMTSGLNTMDSYIYNWMGLNAMTQANDWVQSVLDRPMAEKPGTQFEYSNCVTFMLSAIIQKTTKQNTLKFMEKHLFGPLGITDVRWASSPKGINVGYGMMWLTPHDMAKIGWLYLNKGQWGDQQIVSEKWVRDSTQKHYSATLFDGYGYQWWISPDKFYAAVGYGGQFIFVVPQKNMVVVFTSTLKRDEFFKPENLLSEFIIPAAVSGKPFPENSKQTARLNSLISKGAESQPYIWKTKEEGVAQDSLFTRTAMPAFKFRYPPGCLKVELHPELPHQVMHMKTMDENRFAAYVIDTPKNISLKDFAGKYYVPKLEDLNPNFNVITIISNKEIVLKGNTTAYQTNITFISGGWPMNLELVVAQRQNKYVYVESGGWAGRSLEDQVKIV